MNAHSPQDAIAAAGGRPSPETAAALRRRQLLHRLDQDRGDLVEVAHSLRGLAERVESAQSTLALAARSLRWLALAGSAVTLTLWLRNPRRSPSLAVAALSLQVLHHWLRPAPSRRCAPLRRIAGPVSPVGPPAP